MIFELFESKRPPTMLDANSPFYIAVNCTRPHEASVWFKKSPMGVDRIGHIMSRMSKKAELRGHYTNHSVRRTMCTQLIRAGICPTLVTQLTGHASINSLSRYATASIDQQKAMCEILQGPAPVNCPSEIPNPVKRARTLPSSKSVQNNALTSISRAAPVQSHSNEISSTVQGMFAGASFSNVGEIHIHVHNNT